MLTATEFLKTVLAPAGPEARGWFTTFEVAPEDADRAQWGGRKVSPDELPAINGSNAYYSVAAFHKEAKARAGKDMIGVCVLLADDVGTKGDTDRLRRDLGEPSFKIQTSAKSQQWGYLLDRLATEDEIRPVHDRLKQLSLCDRNGAGPTRYGRLPAGINNKRDYAEAFKVTCVDWHPERRFNLADIAGRLAAGDAPLDPAPAPQDEWDLLAALITSGESYHDPLNSLAMKYAHNGHRPADIMAILRGLMLSSEDRSARWKARYDDIERTVNTAFAKVEADGAERPTIMLRAGRLPEAVDAVIATLAERGAMASIFVRSGELVRPYVAERRGLHNLNVESLELTRIGAPALVYELGQLVQFKRHSKGKGGSTRVAVQDCPPQVASVVLSVPHRWGALPRLDTFAAVPLYLGDGELLARSGYHADRAAWLTVPAGISVPKRPTRAQCEDALARLREWIEEFPFDGDLSESVMVAALMTAALRPSLTAAPGFAFDAPEFGVGKSTAATLVCVVGTGRSPSVMQFHADPEELRKSIDAAQIAGVAAMLFDNVPPEVRIGSDALAQVLTEPERIPRELGVSLLRTVACSQLVILTGCNLQIADDLTRRLLVCRLDPPSDPLARQFRRPTLIEEAKQRRAQMLSDLFTVVAGGGHDTEAPAPLVGYGQWCAWVQHPLVALGMADPVESVRLLTKADPAREALSLVLEYWWQLHHDRWLRVRELLAGEKAWTKEKELPIHWALLEVLREECGTERSGAGNKPDSRKLGQWLRARRARWTAGGYRLDWRATSAGNPAQWRVVWREGNGSEGSNGSGPPPTLSKSPNRETAEADLNRAPGGAEPSLPSEPLDEEDVM